MPGNVFVNEVRIPLERLKSLEVVQYRSSGLSTGHKKRLEFLLASKQSCISMFDGDVLFSLDTMVTQIEHKKQRLLKFLAQHIHDFQESSVEVVKLQHAHERVIERLTFAMISFLAAQQGRFTLYGRTLLIPSKHKSAHFAVETTMTIEDGFIKLYFTPTILALINIENTQRQERDNLELVGLCKYRVECELANDDGSCPYVYPGRLGYYADEMSVAQFSESRKEKFKNAYDACPQISNVNNVILVKASKKATNTLAHPSFVVNSRFSRTDLQVEVQLARQYRHATLMWPDKRWQYTNEWINEIFGDQSQLKTGDLEIPVEIKLYKAHPINRNSNLDYKAIQIPNQQVVNNKQDLKPRPQSGGWLFSNGGAYDREDPNRPFDEIHPYLIVPQNMADLSRELMNIFSDTEYTPRKKGDQGFSGLNLPENMKKFNCGFVNVWDEEEGIFLVDGSEADYMRAVDDVKREWNKSQAGQHDLNRIALVIKPESPTDEEITLYHKMKRVFLEEGIPSQFITIETLRGLEDASVAFGPVLHSLWLNIYAKLGGKPWRLANQLENVHCFIGIGFGLNPRRIGNHIYAGVAHIFDKYGSWLDVASDSRNLSESERESFEGPEKYLEGTSSFKISKSTTQKIIYDALRLYQEYQTRTGDPPKNIVLHKLGLIHECEIIGFMEGARQVLGTLNDCRLGILQIDQEHNVRLYGDEVKVENQRANSKKNFIVSEENRTVVQGTALKFNNHKVALATTGRTAKGDSRYYGIGTPTPLLLNSKVPSSELLQRYGCSSDQFYSIEILAKHVMALTQLHWGSTKDNIRLPITVLYGHKVADLISKTGAKVDTWLSYHRPWFL